MILIREKLHLQPVSPQYRANDIVVFKIVFIRAFVLIATSVISPNRSRPHIPVECEIMRSDLKSNKLGRSRDIGSKFYKIFRCIRAPLLSRAFAFSGFLFILLLSQSGLLFSANNLSAENGTPDQIQYVQSGRDSFAAKLVPDFRPGLVPNDPRLVEVTTNGNLTAFQLTPSQEGQLDLSGILPGLEEGRHTAAVKTLFPDGNQKDRKQLLFIVDTQSPLIALVEPEGSLFPRSASTVRFRIVDPDNGSGVPIDPAECGLKVTAQGATVQETSLIYENNELNLLVFVAFPSISAKHDRHFNVSVSLKDRAGNVGRASETFAIGSLVSPDFSIYKCGGGASFTQTASEILVEPSLKALGLSAGTGRELVFYTYGYSGVAYHYPELVRRKYGRAQPPEFYAMTPHIQKAVGDLIEITSDSKLIEVEKLKDDDFEDNQMAFRIAQKNLTTMGDQVANLKVTIPVALRIDPAGVNFCQANNQIDSNDPHDSVYAHIPADAFNYTFETFTIPVFLEAKADPFTLKVEQEGDQLVARVAYSPIELIDTSGSWFEFDGQKYWFERQGNGCLAKGPAQEGVIRVKTAIRHKNAAFLAAGGNAGAGNRTMYNEGEVVVCMAPPVIEGFRYDRETNTLKATINDQGTPRENLTIALGLAGHPLDSAFDPATGKLSAALPYFPVAVQTASLQVTDFAKQTATADCKVFGEIEQEDESDRSGSDATTRKALSYSRNTRDIRKVIGTTGDGRAVVQICEEASAWGFYRGGRFVPMSGNPAFVRLVQLRSRDPENVYDSRRAVIERLPLRMEMIGESYDRRRYEPIPESAGGITSFSMTGSQATTGKGRDFYFVVMARDGNRNIPIRNTGAGIALPFQLRKFEECRLEKRDILAPVIRPRYDGHTNLLRASIHDHGMPLAELKIELTAESDTSRSNSRWGYRSHSRGSRPAFSFRNGTLISQFTPPPKGEFFTLKIRAEDRAGNFSLVPLDIMMPREPPEVILEAETQGTEQVIRRYGEQASAYLTAIAKDDSRIVEEKTVLWLDDQVLRPYERYSRAIGGSGRNRFNYKAGYVAGVEEGPHLARFRATDATGLWAETQTAFDYRLSPFIYDFKVMPDAVRKIGGPALTAMIVDQGGDLDISGLALTIDGQAVDTDKLYYDPASGYFSVDGPLELADGRHVAEITAKDRHGNQVRETLCFTRAMEITTPYQSGGRGLLIDGLTLMELEDHNGDGRANPGEFVRLFISLKNDTDVPLSCTASLASEDLDIDVETEIVSYNNMEPGSTLVPLKGFDLRIGRDILDKVIGDPYETYFNLALGCDPDQEWAIPFKIPIYIPSIPIGGGLTVALDRLPPSTTETDIRVQGKATTSAEFVDRIELRVNGMRQRSVSLDRVRGRFEAVVSLADGANTIEVLGVDSDGSRGSASGFVFRTTAFTPPSIAITSPSNGDFFQCDNLTVTGTYSVGSGTLDSIAVEAPWEMGGCPVTIIDGSNFTIDCGDVTSGPADVYDIEATIETTDGVQAIDAITITVGDCS